MGVDETEKENFKHEIKYNTELEGIVSSFDDNALIGWNNSTLIYANNAAETLFGYSKNEIKNVERLDLFSPMQESETIAIEACFSNADNDGKPFEIICKKKHGQEFFGEASIRRSKLLSEETVFLSIKDISEKKNLQKAIFNHDNRFRGVIDSLNEGVWLFDSDYKTVFISPVVLRFLNYSIDEILEKRIFYFIKDSGFEFDKRFFEEEKSARYSNLNLIFIKKDNSLFQSKTNIIPLKNDKGAFLGGILSITDLTEILNRDIDITGLKERNSGLEKKIKNLEIDLQQSKKLILDYKKESENLILELEEKINSSKSATEELKHGKQFVNRLYSVIQNNLRSQIINLTGFAEFLESVWGKLTGEQQISYLKILHSNAQESRRIFDKICLFFKIESGKPDIRTGIVAISSFTENILKNFDDKIQAKELNIIKEINPDLLINGDGNFAGFVLHEILSNAVKHSPVKGDLKIGLQPVHDKISLTIQDSGNGIGPDKLKKLFDLDYSAPTNDANGLGVSGLSLFLIKNLVELHNGSLEISSEEEKGTKINIILPAAPKTIFIIANPGDCEILTDYFAGEGIEVKSFNDTTGALKSMNGSSAPAAFFVTYSQPEEKLFGFLKELGDSIRTKIAPVVVMSSDDTNEYKKKLLNYGISTLVTLPLTAENIRSAFSCIFHK